MATLLFSPLPSPSFLHRNPNPNYNSSSFICRFTPISISFNAKPFLKRSFTASAPAAAVEFDLSSSPTASGNELLDISKLGISQEIVSALSRRGITELFPIQRAVLEPAMGGRDMIGRAITGSGKTLAFGIPILNNIIRNRTQHRQKSAPAALVLAPTRELARQVQKEFKESAPNLSSACLYGGVPISNQMRLLGFGLDIAVGTPGRIIDLVERGALNLSEVKFVVLDEADQMLAIGFQEDVECILSYLPAKKQCMLFSATMPSWVNQLSKKFLRNPLMVDLVGDSDQKLAEGISLYSISSTSSRKQNILPSLISRYGPGGKSIVFTKTKKDAEELSRSMGNILGSRALHGNMNQFQRDKTITAFRDGRFNVLFATDVAARGLDIPNVDLVVHFELPNTSEIFVHRSGRTGRAGNKGNAVLMFTESQRRAVKFIERDLGCKFEELPRIKDGTGNRTATMDAEGSDYGRYDNSVRHQFGQRDDFRERHFGNYGGFQRQKYGNANDNRTQRSNNFRHSEGNFEGFKISRRNPSSENRRTGHTYFEKSRRSNQSHNDFENNSFTRNGLASDVDSLGSRSRSRTSKYQFDSEAFDFDGSSKNDRNHLRGKRQPKISESSADDFKQILDALRGNRDFKDTEEV